MFIFGGFTLVANSAVHLGQVEAFAPGEIVRFGNIEYTTDYCGELIITGGVSPDLGADSLDLDVRSNLGVIGGCRFFLTHPYAHPAKMGGSTSQIPNELPGNMHLWEEDPGCGYRANRGERRSWKVLTQSQEQAPTRHSIGI